RQRNPQGRPQPTGPALLPLSAPGRGVGGRGCSPGHTPAPLHPNAKRSSRFLLLAPGRKSWAPRRRGRTLYGQMPNALPSGAPSLSATAAGAPSPPARPLPPAASSDEQPPADFLARRSDEAFAALLGRHGPMVWGVCRRILHDAHAAEDVFQATFLVLAD